MVFHDMRLWEGLRTVEGFWRNLLLSWSETPRHRMFLEVTGQQVTGDFVYKFMRDINFQHAVALVLLCCVGCTAGPGRSSHRISPSAQPGQGDVAPQYPQGSVPDPNLTLRLADVDHITATYEPVPAPHARVVISGTLADGATRIHDIRQQRVDGGVTLSVITARPKDAVATLAIIPFERVVTVDLQGQPAGIFSISANTEGATVVVP
jgi:hypothetical protein